MIDVYLDAACMARARLALSPVSEALQLLALAAGGRRHPVLGDPGPLARAALSDPDVALVAAVTQPDGTGYTPDLLTPKPLTGTDRSILDTQLDAVASTTLERAALELTTGRFPAGRMPRQVRSAMDAGTFATRAAAGLATFWHNAFADTWTTIRTALEQDLARRADTMTRKGVGYLLGGLHPRLSFDGDQLHFASRFTETCHLEGEDLVLTPTVFGWPTFSLQVCDPTNAIITFPASGVADGPPGRGPLATLLGSSRALILADLGVPRSTDELSRRHSLAPATVSYHLRVMFKAGLLLRSREGHHVRYRRSPHGQLISEHGE